MDMNICYKYYYKKKGEENEYICFDIYHFVVFDR